MTKFVFVHIPEWWAFFTAACLGWLCVNTFVIAFKDWRVDKEEKD